MPLQGEGLYSLVPRALPWAVNWLPFQGAGGGFELIEFWQRGRGAAPQFDVGLRRRNNELNELTNCRAAWLRGIAPERGSYFRIGACPYLPPQLINSRCCPCKGRISWAGLAPQHLSRYEPLTGARFINRLQEVGASPYPKYEPPSGALAPHFIISPARPRNSLIRVIRCYAVRGQIYFVVILPQTSFVVHPVTSQVRSRHKSCAYRAG